MPKGENQYKKLLVGTEMVLNSEDEDGNQIYCTDCHDRDSRAGRPRHIAVHLTQSDRYHPYISRAIVSARL
jgi:hypothetical protein